MPQVLNAIGFILFAASLAFCKPHVSSSSLACSEDSDCVVIGQGGCCGADLAVHKDFAEKLRKPSDEKCHSMRVQCLKTKALCHKQKCTLKVTQPEKRPSQ